MPLGRPLRRWVLFVVPLITFVLASADALLLLVHSADSNADHWKLALATTVPLSAAACALTAWIQFRLRAEIGHRISIEARLRTALVERGQAVADSSRALERERLLLRELDHRVRNNLASLQGLVGLYEGASIEPAELVRSLRGRISALREVYGLIGATPDEGVDVQHLLSSIAALTTPPSASATIQATGPPLRLQSHQATALAMILHELFTNACKHGALRMPGGSIRATWSVRTDAAETRLHLCWDEAPVESPVMRRNAGSGLALVEGIARCDLRGRVSCGGRDGHWIVDIDALLMSSAPRPQHITRKEVLSS